MNIKLGDTPENNVATGVASRLRLKLLNDGSLNNCGGVATGVASRLRVGDNVGVESGKETQYLEKIP